MSSDADTLPVGENNYDAPLNLESAPQSHHSSDSVGDMLRSDKNLENNSQNQQYMMPSSEGDVEGGGGGDGGVSGEVSGDNDHSQPHPIIPGLDQYEDSMEGSSGLDERSGGGGEDLTTTAASAPSDLPPTSQPLETNLPPPPSSQITSHDQNQLPQFDIDEQLPPPPPQDQDHLPPDHLLQVEPHHLQENVGEKNSGGIGGGVSDLIKSETAEGGGGNGESNNSGGALDGSVEGVSGGGGGGSGGEVPGVSTPNAVNNYEPFTEVLCNTCPVCNEYFEDRDDLLIHRRSHRYSYICSICKKGMDTKGGLNAHVNTAHVKRPPYVRKKPKKPKPPRPHPVSPPPSIRAPPPIKSTKSNHRTPKPPKVPKTPPQQLQQPLPLNLQPQQHQQQQVLHSNARQQQQQMSTGMDTSNVLAAYMSRPSGGSSFQSMLGVGGASAGNLAGVVGGQQSSYSPPISLTTHHHQQAYGHPAPPPQNQHFQASSVSQQNQFHPTNQQTQQFQHYLSQQHLGGHSNILGLPPQPQTYGHPSLSKAEIPPEQSYGMYHHHLDPSSMQSVNYGLGYHHLEQHGQGGPYSTNN